MRERRYAAETAVPVEKSRAEIESLLRRYGGTAFMSGWDQDRAYIAFMMHDRQVRFVLTLPDRTDRKFTHTAAKGRLRAIDDQNAQWEQACRQSWRALALVIKAKLEAVAAGITVFEDEFLAHIVLPGGVTVGEAIRDNLAIAYQQKRVTGLLPDYSKP